MSMGLKQRCHISPYLFILAADCLNKILSKDIGLNHFFGLGPSLSHGHEILTFQYADDTLFLKTDKYVRTY
jgi:hypothetical protein